MANRYIKGLNKDTAPVDQIDGSWRHAKNVVMNPIKGGISNEKGFTFNEEDHKLNLNYKIICKEISVRAGSNFNNNNNIYLKTLTTLSVIVA